MYDTVLHLRSSYIAERPSIPAQCVFSRTYLNERGRGEGKIYRGDASKGMDNRVIKGALKEIRNFIYGKPVSCSESIFARLGQAQLLSLILPLNKSFVNCGDRNSERWQRSTGDQRYCRARRAMAQGFL